MLRDKKSHVTQKHSPNSSLMQDFLQPLGAVACYNPLSRLPCLFGASKPSLIARVSLQCKSFESLI